MPYTSTSWATRLRPSTPTRTLPLTDGGRHSGRSALPGLLAAHRECSPLVVHECARLRTDAGRLRRSDGAGIAQLLTATPADDLVLQWDICGEVLALALQDQFGVAWQPPGGPVGALSTGADQCRATRAGPDPHGLPSVLWRLGPYTSSRTARLESGGPDGKRRDPSGIRPIDFFHMPVPRSRDDAAYFAPLKDLEIGAANSTLASFTSPTGLRERCAGFARLNTPTQALEWPPSVASGRRPQDTLPELYRIHAEAAAALSV